VPLTEEEEDERDLRRDPIVPTKRWRKIWARRLGDLRSVRLHAFLCSFFSFSLPPRRCLGSSKNGL
jgi:hypothetical protein